MSGEAPPEPRRQDRFVGHAAAVGILASAAASDRLHHAWMVAGPRGIGKATLAFRFARYLLAGEGRGFLAETEMPPLHVAADNPVFRRVAAGGHSDLRVLEPAGAGGEIGVNDVRAAIRFLRLTPGEGVWRVLIVDGADAMNPNAQNAILKLLEEPPPNVLILLVVHRPTLLLETVRSRCRMLRLAPLDRAAFDDVLRGIAPETDSEARGRLFAVSGGSPGAALELEQLDGPMFKEAIDTLFDNLPDLDRPVLERIAAAVTESREPARFEAFGRILMMSLAARLRTAGAGAAWLETEPRISRLLDRGVALSLDRRQVVGDIFQMLAQAAAGRRPGVGA